MPVTLLPKAPTGVRGLDEITGGGLPRGRPTLICGSAGCGKTLLALEFLVRGALESGEPGVFLAFEERTEDLMRNVGSLGFDLDDLRRQKVLYLEHVEVDQGPGGEAGGYDLEALFLRLGRAVDAIGAKRVALDCIEALFIGLPDEAMVRVELRRLFRWLRERDLTVIITAERGGGTFTRHGLEEYVSDCVLSLDHVLREHVLTRYLRIVKYRGSTHGTNEYPFLIDGRGISVLPITSLGLEHGASLDRVPTGIPGLDELLEGRGFYRGSSVLVTGSAGSGKTSVAVHAAEASCRRGESCLYIAFEESPEQIIRNMRSIGLDLTPWVERGLLRFHTARPSVYGLEMHLVRFHRLVEELEPSLVILDPITSFTSVGGRSDICSMLVRLVDFLKSRQITTLLTDLTSGGEPVEQTEIGVASLMDVWILLRTMEREKRRDRVLSILKARGMAHSTDVWDYRITSRGIQLGEPPSGLRAGAGVHSLEREGLAGAPEGVR